MEKILIYFKSDWFKNKDENQLISGMKNGKNTPLKYDNIQTENYKKFN